MASLHRAYAITYAVADAHAATAHPDSLPPATRPGQELVLAQSLALLQAKQLDQQREDRQHDTARVLQEVVRHQTSALKHAKRQVALAAVVGTGLTALIALSKTLGLDVVGTERVSSTTFVDRHLLSDAARVALTYAFAAISAILGLLAWRASARVTWLETALEDAGDELSDRNSYLELLNEVRSRSDLGVEWTRNQLMDAVEEWASSADKPRRAGLVLSAIRRLVFAAPRQGVPLREIANLVQRADFTNLIIAKGLERELLTEQRVTNDGRVQYRYSLAP